MTTPACETLLDQIRQHITSGFDAITDGDDCVIVTPYTQPDQANIELVVRPQSTGYILTDEGETLGTLFVNGLTITPAIKHEITRIARIHNVQFDGAALYSVADAVHLGASAQNLASAIQAAGFLIYKRSHRTMPRFEDDIENYLVQNRITYALDYRLRGYAIEHTIPFYFNHRRNILLEPLTASSPSAAQNKAKQLGFKWGDLRRANITGNFTVVLDDSENNWERVWLAPNTIDILRSYSDNVIRWQAERLRFHELVVQPAS